MQWAASIIQIYENELLLTYRSFLDPTLEIDVYAEKPWALSPTLATFNYLSLHADKPEYTHSIEEDSLERLGDIYTGGKSTYLFYLS